MSYLQYTARQFLILILPLDYWGLVDGLVSDNVVGWPQFSYGVGDYINMQSYLIILDIPCIVYYSFGSGTAISIISSSVLWCTWPCPLPQQPYTL